MTANLSALVQRIRLMGGGSGESVWLNYPPWIAPASIQYTLNGLIDLIRLLPVRASIHLPVTMCLHSEQPGDFQQHRAKWRSGQVKSRQKLSKLLIAPIEISPHFGKHTLALLLALCLAISLIPTDTCPACSNEEYSSLTHDPRWRVRLSALSQSGMTNLVVAVQSQYGSRHPPLAVGSMLTKIVPRHTWHNLKSIPVRFHFRFSAPLPRRPIRRLERLPKEKNLDRFKNRVMFLGIFRGVVITYATI